MSTVFLISGQQSSFQVFFETFAWDSLSFSKEGRFAEKNNTLASVAQSPFVDAVSFIPTDPSTPQLLFARRTEIEDWTGFVPPLAFYEGEFASEITLVTRDSLRAAIRGLEAQLIGQVKKVLDCFLKDRETRAIALTFRPLRQTVTRIWAKPN